MSGTGTTSRRLRCAIYTRKSTEEGLDQDFNSLDAQHEACAAYITSQASLGWKLVPDRYDDGGISGGTMDRPALQRLLADIREHRVDVVVVYKIDRLTRSLSDFARIVETFDQAEASFVSVTQQFNTTTSMGRLTLNVLLSFAQFEREVTAERIRDKIAASKKKGMWMGGTVPLGYRVDNRKLIVHPRAALEIRSLFDRYLELGSVVALVAELNRQGDGNGKAQSLLLTDTGQGRRRVPKRVRYGKLYYMLSNPIYVGKVRHGGNLYEGEHEAIVDEDVFGAVQQKLAAQAPRQRGVSAHSDSHLLKGLLFDETGDRLSPIHATKSGKRYRYYVSSRLKAGCQDGAAGWRLPSSEIEEIVIRRLRSVFLNKAELSMWMSDAGLADRIDVALERATGVAARFEEEASREAMADIIHLSIRRIDLAKERIRMTIDRSAIIGHLAGEISDIASPHDKGEPCVITLPLSIKRRGVERRLVIEGEGGGAQRPDQPLIDLVVRAAVYLREYTNGKSRDAIATLFGVHPEEVSRLLPLAFLSPTIVDAILTGQQPADLAVRDMTRKIDLPMDWTSQHELLGL